MNGVAHIEPNGEEVFGSEREAQKTSEVVE
jgi:hypothetical protein